MEKTLLLQGKILKLQQLFAKNWLQYGGPGYQSRVVAGRLSKSVGLWEVMHLSQVNPLDCNQILVRVADQNCIPFTDSTDHQNPTGGKSFLLYLFCSFSCRLLLAILRTWRKPHTIGFFAVILYTFSTWCVFLTWVCVCDWGSVWGNKCDDLAIVTFSNVTMAKLSPFLKTESDDLTIITFDIFIWKMSNVLMAKSSLWFSHHHIWKGDNC